MFDIPEAHYELARLLEGKHQMSSAIDHLRGAIRLNSELTEALNDLAWTLATQQNESLRNVTKIGSRLKLYESQRAYRE